MTDTLSIVTISNLPTVELPLLPNDLTIIDQNGVTCRVSLADLIAHVSNPVYADIEVIAEEDGVQSILVPTNNASVFIQGQRQSASSFTITNQTLVIPSESGVLAGNLIIIEPK